MAAPASAQAFVDFVNASPTPYHAVASAAALLEKAGFSKIKERDNWNSSLKPGGKYYLTRNGSSIVAFAVGGKWEPGNPIAMIGAHTDSPVLKVKPVSKRTNVGFLQVGVETYGGGIWHTWFDRDLSIAGRVLVRDDDDQDTIVQRLIKVDRPLLRIPTLAIHLDRNKEFSPNSETELFPIVGLAEAELNRTRKESDFEEVDGSEGEEGGAEPEHALPLKAMSDRHHPYLLDIIAKHADVATDGVVDFDLSLYDTQKSCIGGLNNEFIFSPRLDNLNSTFCAVVGLVESIDLAGLEKDGSIRLVASFDHEEVGSKSAHGADSNLLPAIIRRLSVLPRAPPSSSKKDEVNKGQRGDGDAVTAFEQTLATSFLISADMAHSVHPNYVSKYEAVHQPEINKGVVLKVSSSQKYTTNSPGIVLLQEVARRAGVPLQLFVIRNDSPSGSTIGPMLSAKLGVRTLDLGNPQLSMHSIRETGGTHDIGHAIRLFAAFFAHYGVLEAKILVD